MKKINPKYIEKVNQLANSCPFSDLLSMKICDVGKGTMVAHGTSIVIIQPGKGIPTEEPLPPKFL